MYSKKASRVAGVFRESWDYKVERAKESGKAKRDWASFDPRGNVYLIGNKTLGFYKIGLTRDCEAPDARFKTIQRGVPFDLDVLRYWFVLHAGSFEKLLHYEFQDNLIRGEWFHFEEGEMDAITSRIKYLAEKVAVVENQQDAD